MVRLKPTTLIALDPYTAAFCDAVRQRLLDDSDEHRKLIQFYALRRDTDSLQFTEDLASVANPSFDLEDIRGKSGNVGFEEARAFFSSVAIKIEPQLIEILSGTRQINELGVLQSGGVEVLSHHVIHLLLSSPDLFAGGIVVELGRLIQWLFATRFASDLHRLECIVLFPELFEHAEMADYASAYAVLKNLDFNLSEGIRVTASQKMPPFDFCWIIDSRKSRTDYLGSLAANLASYSDAFTGFLIAEPERSGALITHKARGKTPAYSTFGYAELFFPFETVITRLSSALASDIVTNAFLAESVVQPERKRKHVLGAKQFVLSNLFIGTLNSLSNESGYGFFDPTVEVKEGRGQEYVTELQLEHDNFERNELIKYLQDLELRREATLTDLLHLLDFEIDWRVDALSSGLREVLEFLDILTDSALPLETDLIGDPENLVTQQLTTEALLDSRLGVIATNEKTAALLKEADGLRAQLGSLRTTLRLMPIEKNRNNVAEETKGQSDSKESQEDMHTGVDQRVKALKEVEGIKQRLHTISKEYEIAFNQEHSANIQARKEAQHKLSDSQKQRVLDAEKSLIDQDSKLREKRRLRDDIYEQRRGFIRRYLILYPVVALSVILFLPLLARLSGFDWGAELIYGENRSTIIAGIAVLGLAYYSVAFLIFISGINRKKIAIDEEIKSLRLGLKSISSELRTARNDQSHFKYKLHAQQMRISAILDLIEAARKSSEDIRITIVLLTETRDLLNRNSKEAIPVSSQMKRSVLRTDDIDGYYQKEITHIEQEAGIFIAEQLKRSQIRRIPIEQFQTKLKIFARERFRRLEELSIVDILVRPDLIPPNTATDRLKELSTAAQPLLRLSEVDFNRDKISQRDETLWVEASDREHLLELYQKITHQISAHTHDDRRSIKLLTRWLYFPAYFLGQIDYFRTCYNRSELKEAADLPDLVPVEIGLGGELKRALEQLLKASALGIIQPHDGNYFFFNLAGERLQMGGNFYQIAERLATDFSSQGIYTELSDAVREQSVDQNRLYKLLVEYQRSASDLSTFEKQTLETLVEKNHPLR